MIPKGKNKSLALPENEVFLIEPVGFDPIGSQSPSRDTILTNLMSFASLISKLANYCYHYWREFDSKTRTEPRLCKTVDLDLDLALVTKGLFTHKF